MYILTTEELSYVNIRNNNNSYNKKMSTCMEDSLTGRGNLVPATELSLYSVLLKMLLVPMMADYIYIGDS